MSALPSMHRTWAKVRDERCCRICGRERDPKLHFPPKNGWITGHHLVPKSQRGGDSEDNIVPLCWICHRLVDSHKPQNQTERERLRRHLRANLTEAEVEYCVHLMGRPWLDRNYPPADDAEVMGAA